MNFIRERGTKENKWNLYLASEMIMSRSQITTDLLKSCKHVLRSNVKISKIVQTECSFIEELSTMLQVNETGFISLDKLAMKNKAEESNTWLHTVNKWKCLKQQTTQIGGPAVVGDDETSKCCFCF